MLSLILGRAGSGKTTHLRNLLCEYIRTGDKDCVLIVPEQYSFDTERDMLEILGAKAMQKLDILSFSRLAEKALGLKFLNDKPDIDDGVRSVVMSMAVESVADRGGIYSNSAHSEKTIKRLLSADEQFKQAALKPEELADISLHMDDCPLKSKAEEVALILAAYNAILNVRFQDRRDSLTRLARLLTEFRFFKNKIVAIDAFRGFTAQEYLVLEQIIRQADAVYVSLCSDTLRDEDDGMGVFSHTKRAIKKLVALADKNNIPKTKPAFLSGASKYNNFPKHIEKYNAPELKFLEEKLLSGDNSVFAQPVTALSIARADNYFDECDFVACTAKRLIREQNLRCRDIAVIERNSGTYTPTLVSAFKRYGLPVYEDRRHAISTEPLISLVLSVLEIAARGFSSDAVMRYSKNPLSPVSFEEACDIDNYALLWQIEGSAWKNEWTLHPDGFGVERNEKSDARLEKLNTIRRRAVEPLIAFSRDISAKTGAQMCESVYNFLQSHKVPEKLREYAEKLNNSGLPAAALDTSRVWDTLMDILDSLSCALDSVTVNEKRYYEMFSLICSSTQIGSIPQGLDEITIGSADRIRLGAPKVVFVVGVNQGVFPLQEPNEGIFNESETKTLLEAGFELADSSREFSAQERFIEYSVLSAASDRLYITYSNRTLTGAALVQSELVDEIQTRFPSLEVLSVSDIPILDRVESAESAFVRAALNCREKSGRERALIEVLSEKPEYSNKLRALEDITERREKQFENTAVSEKLFSFQTQLSASRVENYYSCAFKYFCRYGLGAMPRGRAELDAAQNGLVVHYVLEQLLGTYSKAELMNMTSFKRDEIIRNAVDLYVKNRMGGAQAISKRLHYLLGTFAVTINNILDRLVSEFGVSDFVTRDVELPVGRGGEIKAYEVALPGGEKLCIGGIIDRVDVMERDGKSYLRVVDYKTGGKDFKLEEVCNGLNLQMLIYLLCLWDNAGVKYGDIIPAGVLYFPAKIGTLSLGRNASEDEIAAQRIKNGKMNGIILADADVINGMEAGGGGLYIPAKIDKDGNIKGNIVSLEMFSRLHGIIDSLLAEMSQNLREGKIPALPISGTGHERTCEYCDYSSVCLHDENDPVKTVDKAAVMKISEGVQPDE